MHLEPARLLSSSILCLAIAGELLTAFAMGIMALFFPIDDWIQWPVALRCAHYVMVANSSLILAILFLTRPTMALKPAIILAGYFGFPLLL